MNTNNKYLNKIQTIQSILETYVGGNSWMETDKELIERLCEVVGPFTDNKDGGPFEDYDLVENNEYEVSYIDYNDKLQTQQTFAATMGKAIDTVLDECDVDKIVNTELC